MALPIIATVAIARTRQSAEKPANTDEQSNRLPSQHHSALASVNDRNMTRPAALWMCWEMEGCAGTQPSSQANRPVAKLARP